MISSARSGLAGAFKMSRFPGRRVTAMHLVATIALAALLVLMASESRAQALDKPNPSVSAWLPGCRAFLEHADATGSEGAGLCAGTVDALLYIGEVLMPDYSFCVPLRTPRREVISSAIICNFLAGPWTRITSMV